MYFPKILEPQILLYFGICIKFVQHLVKKFKMKNLTVTSIWRRGVNRKAMKSIYSDMADNVKSTQSPDVKKKEAHFIWH